MKLTFFGILSLGIIADNGAAHDQYALRHGKTPLKRAHKQHMNKGKDETFPVKLQRGSPGRHGMRALKGCGKANGKSKGNSRGKGYGKGKGKSRRTLSSCVDYGDPGDDPIGKGSPSGSQKASPTGDPTTLPTLSPSLLPTADDNRAGSGSNKGTDIDFEYDPYDPAASGSNDQQAEAEDADEDVEDRATDDTDDFGVIDVLPDGNETTTDDDDSEEVVPSNDGVPSNDP
eukprot:scaffold2353_cov134-Cylindrotheca_fusiformis.AAC.5